MSFILQTWPDQTGVILNDPLLSVNKHEGTPEDFEEVGEREESREGGAVNCSSTSSESVCLSWWCKSSNFISLVTHSWSCCSSESHLGSGCSCFLWVESAKGGLINLHTDAQPSPADCWAPELHFSSSARPDLLGDLSLPTVTCLLDCVRALFRGILSLVLRPEPRVFLHLLFLRVSWLFTLCVIAATATC